MLFIGFQVWECYAPLPIRDWNKKNVSRIKVSDPEDSALYNGKTDIIVRRIDGEGIMARFIDLMEDYVLEWGLAPRCRYFTAHSRSVYEKQVRFIIRLFGE